MIGIIGALVLALQPAPTPPSQPAGGAVLTAPPLATPTAAAPDYRQPSAWLCRPGHDEACAVPLDAVRIDASGQRTPAPFVEAADPKVDCFYVYPTVSRDPTPLSDLNPGPEELNVVKQQFARFGSRCRLFAPMYRQVTLAGLNARMRGGATAFDWSAPLQDVKAAWDDYLAHDNKGRGVILIGHSQGTILLSMLIAAEIEGKPVEKRIVAAYLAGHPGLAAREGAGPGEAFPGLPICRSAAQTGCTEVWSSFLVTDASSPLSFGRDGSPPRKAGCVNPAAPSGGPGVLKPYFGRPPTAPEGGPPFVTFVGGLSAQCVADGGGNVLRVTVEPGPNQAALTAFLARPGLPGWGLHTYDVNLVLGNLLDQADAKIAAWSGRR